MDTEYELITIPGEDNRPAEMQSNVRTETPDSLPPLEPLTEVDNNPDTIRLEKGMQAIYDNINKLLAEYGDTGMEDLEEDEFPSRPEPIDYILDDIRTDMRADGVDPKTRDITHGYLEKVGKDLRLHYDLYYGKYKSLKMPAVDGSVYWLDTIIESIRTPAPKLTQAAQQALSRDILKRIHTKGAELMYIEHCAEDGKRVGYVPVTGCSNEEQIRGIMEICAYTNAWLDTNPDYLIWL
jgi:hypothetical protein